MISTAWKAIIEHSGTPLEPSPPSIKLEEYRFMEGLLFKRNGFMAFGGALRIFPYVVKKDKKHRDLVSWNEFMLWKYMYGDALKNKICFAENFLGDQFCYSKNGVEVFEIDTKQSTHLSNSIDELGDVFFSDDNNIFVELFAECQEKYGIIDSETHLCPLKPFILGGEYLVDNFRPLNCIESIKSRAELANQLADLDEGTPVSIATTHDDS